jgi:3D-(3,5/4)-trihydroxycyclohexane-1,2-dione acylhydrolase (decyclizing)
VMTDPANCGPVTLSFCQDTQAEAFDYPVSFFEPRVWRIRRSEPDSRDVADLGTLIKDAKNPVIVCGGGVIYSQAEQTLGDFATRHRIPVIETQAGKSALAQSHPMNFGAAGVDGAQSANRLAEAADLVIGVGTRFQDFTTGSWALFKEPNRKLVSINVQGYDACKHGATGVVGDAKVTLEKLSGYLGDHRSEAFEPQDRLDWLAKVDAHCSARADVPDDYLPLDAEVIGAVQRTSDDKTIAMCAAGTMPGALKLLWQAPQGGYHMEYGFSCMGYEIAGAMGVKLAQPDRDIVCFVGDGSYMMANSELATAVMRKVPFTVVLTDNRGYGCINRLQMGTGGAEFNNLYKDCNVEQQPDIDFVAHAASMGAHAIQATDIADLEAQIVASRDRQVPTVIVIDTDPMQGPGEAGGGHWWDVAVPEVSGRAQVNAARQDYVAALKNQRAAD